MAGIQAVPSTSVPRRSRTAWQWWPLVVAPAALWLVVAFYYRDTLGPELLLLGAVAAVLLIVLGGARSRVLSPVFLYDLVRTARRGHLQGHRFLFGAFLATALFMAYVWQVREFDFFFSQTIVVHQRSELPRITWAFVSQVLIVQYLAVLLVTPAYVATGLPQEKQQRTLEFMLTTDLSDAEIVLGMLGARLANLFQLILTGLPILAILLFLGGVDPQLMLASFLSIVLTMISLGSVTMLVSVFSPRPLLAVLQSYVAVAVYAAAAFCVPLANFANPVVATVEITRALERGESVAAVITTDLAAGILVHGAITFLACRWAVRAFRAASLEQQPLTAPPAAPPFKPVLARTLHGGEAAPTEEVQPLSESELRGWGPFAATAREDATLAAIQALERELHARPRRPVGDDGLLWKETLSRLTREQVAGYFRPGALAIVAGGFVLIFLMHVWIDAHWSGHRGAPDGLNTGFRGLNSAAVCFVLFVAAVNAAGRVSREREQQTLDTLRTVPATAGEILFAKWFGSVWAVLPTCGLIVLGWLLALALTVLHAAALPLLLAAFLIYLTFMSTLGLWLSTVARTTLRSILFSVLVSLLLLTSAGSLVRGVSSFGYARQVPHWSHRLYDHVVSPVQTLWSVSFSSHALLTHDEREQALPDILAAVVALHAYAAATAFLWWSMLRRFEAEKGPPPQLHEKPTAASRNLHHAAS